MVSFPALLARAGQNTDAARLRRLSASASPYVHAQDVYAQETQQAFAIVPVAAAPRAALANNNEYPAPSLSAQLLELGLRHGVSGLVRKAETQLENAATPAHAHGTYDAAQQDFVPAPHLIQRVA